MKAIFYPLLACLLLSCSSAVPVAKSRNQPALSQYPLHYYTQQLADNLFAQLPKQQGIYYVAPQIAVASFLPVNTLSLSDVDAGEKQLANQLSESMLAHARQHGLKVYDYHLRQQLLLGGDHEQALSRQLKDIENNSDADTLLVGTYSAMEDGYLVNARLIRLVDKQVLAAASGYVPHNVLWSQQQVGKRGDKLYRQDRTGEQK